MATQFDAGAPRPLPLATIASSPLADVVDMLDAVRTACDAERAEVVAFDEASQQLARVAGAVENGPTGTGELAAANDTFLFASDAISLAQPQYVIETAEVQPTKMTLRLAERGSKRFYLVLQFRDVLSSSRARAMHVVPKLARALGRMLDLETRRLNSERERLAAAAALDQGRCGVVAATAEGRPVVMNEAAAALLAQEDALQVRRGLVRPVNYADAIRFQAALDAAAAHTGADGAEAPPPAMVMLLQRRDGKAPLIVTVTPACGAGGELAGTEGAAVIIHLAQPEPDAIHGLEPVCQLLGLSKVETRLVVQLYRGHTLTEAAGEMRIKVDTARGYLKQIFNKTDTHRQTDLLSLLSQYLRAVRGRFSFRPI